MDADQEVKSNDDANELLKNKILFYGFTVSTWIFFKGGNSI